MLSKFINCCGRDQGHTPVRSSSVMMWVGLTRFESSTDVVLGSIRIGMGRGNIVSNHSRLSIMYY